MEFHPIADYGFIGNLTACALVSKTGSIDWCCLPKTDSPSVFAAILDPAKGGSFVVQPSEEWEECRQEYVPETNVLKTIFVCKGGTLEVTDWMHMGGFTFEEQERHRLPALYRQVQCVEGGVHVRIFFNPQFNYARDATTLSLTRSGVQAEGPNDMLKLYAQCKFTLEETGGASAALTLREGEEVALICSYGRAERVEIPPLHRSLERTVQYWKRWSAECETGACLGQARWRNAVVRSALVLKILAGGRGIAAAATTSLPEILGGADNWDYRYNWIRDSSFTIQALSALGHHTDARTFLKWLSEVLVESGSRPAELRVLYPLHSPVLNPEEELTHLRGDKDSRPVRIGNAASEQRQLDIYGEVLESIYRSEHLHPEMDENLAGVIREIVEHVCEAWHEKDSGIWELRTEPKHYVYSKVMCWVAIDRGIRLAKEHHWNVDGERWQRECDAIHAEVLAKGYSEKHGCFVQSYDSEVLDATALLFPVVEFLPPDHPYMQASLETVQRELAVGPHVYRSSEHKGREGTFGLCSFWLVDALVFAGRLDEARKNFEELLRHGERLGLFAEEIDAETGEFLGNFPQAFTHVGLINSAVYLSRALGQEGVQPLMGEENLP